MFNKVSIYILMLSVATTTYAPAAEANVRKLLGALWERVWAPAEKPVVKPSAKPVAKPVAKSGAKAEAPKAQAAETATATTKAAFLKRTHGYVEDGLNNVTNDFLENTYGRVQSNMNGESVSYGAAIGLDDVAEKLTLALTTKTTSGAIIDAAAGVGKSTAVFRLQEKIQQGKVPQSLLHGQVISVNMSHASATSEEAFLAALEKIPVLKTKKGAVASGPLILHFQKTEGLLSRGGEQFADDIDKLMLLAKRKMGNRQVKFIVEVLSDDLGKLQKKNPVAKSSLTSIHLAQLSDSKIMKVVRQYAKGIQEEDGIIISDALIQKSMDVARRFYADIAPPASVIRMLDKARAAKEITNSDTSVLTSQLRDKLEDLEEQLLRAKSLSGKEARRLKAQIPADIKAVKASIAKIEAASKIITDAQDEMRTILRKYGVKDGDDMPIEKLAKIKMSAADSARIRELSAKVNTLNEHDIARFVNRERDIPMEDVLGRSKLTLENVISAMSRRVIGQDHAVQRLSQLAMKINSAYKVKGKPLGVVWLTGPPGSGKTSGAYAVADIAFKGKIVRVDMAGFKESHNVAQITGTSPGYLGYGDGSSVIDKLIAECSSGCVLLLDEVEEAHRNAIDIWVSAMGDGVLKSGDGKVFDFSKTLIVATTNSVDNVPVNTSLEQMKILLGKAMNLAPKILNRIDDVIPYNSINTETAMHIFGKLTDDFNKQFLSHDMMRLKVLDGAKAHMVRLFQQEMKRAGKSLDKSARDITRIFDRYIRDQVDEIRRSGMYLSGGKQVPLSVNDGDLIIARRVFENKKTRIIFEVAK